MKIKNKLLLVSVLSTSIVLSSKDVEASKPDSLSPSLVLDQEELKKELEIANIASEEESKEELVDNSADEKELSPITEENSKNESIDKVEGLEETETTPKQTNEISDDAQNVEPIEETNLDKKEAGNKAINLPSVNDEKNEEKTDPVVSNPEVVGQVGQKKEDSEDSIDKKETTEKLNQADDVPFTEQKEKALANDTITDEEGLKETEILEKDPEKLLEEANLLLETDKLNLDIDKGISTFAADQPFDEFRDDPIPEEQPSKYGTTTFTLNTELSPLIDKDEIDFESLPEKFIIYYGEGGNKEKVVSRQELANNIILESVDFETKEEYENYRNNYQIFLAPADPDEDDRKFEITYYDNQDQTGLGEITSNETILGVKVELRQIYNPRLDVDTSDLKNRKEIYDDKENSIPITIDWQGIEASSKLTTDMGMEKDSDEFYQPSGLGLAFEYIEDREAEPDLYYTNAEGNRVLLEKNSVLSIDGKNYTVVEYTKDPVKGVYVNLRPEAERKNVNIKPTLNGLDGKDFNPDALPENMTLVYGSDDNYKELNVSREDFIKGVLLGNIEYISEADRNEALANLKLIKAADNSKNKLTYYVESIADPTADEDGNYNINININQVQNPNLTVKWYNKDGERLYGPENDEGKITIDWGESTDDSKLITDSGITRDGKPTGLGLAYEDISNRRKTPKILYEGKELIISTPIENELRDEDGNEIVNAPFVEGTIVNYNGKKYIVTENSIDDINGASISLKEFVSKDQGEEWIDSDTNDSEANTKDIFDIPENAQVEEKQEEIPFEYETIYDEELPEGYHKIEVKGENGEKVVLNVIDPNTGEVINETESIIKRPVTQVERVGTLVKNQESITKEEVKIAYETEIIADDTLELGKTVVDEEGKEGIKTITYTTVIKNDEVVDVIRNEEITVNPVTRVVRLGTKTADIENEVVTTEKKVIHHETEVIPDPTLALGETVVEAEGHDGEITVTNTTKVVNGVVGKTERREEITLKPQTRVVRVGTKTEDTHSTVVSQTEKTIPHETEIIFDENLELGKTEVISEGEDGVLTETHTTEVVNGSPGQTKVTSEITKQPVKRVVKVGTKTEDIKNTVTNTEVRPIDYETEVIFDDTIELGKTVVEKEGEKGELTITFTNEVVNGVVGKTNREEKVTKEPVTRVVRVGTKAEITNIVSHTDTRPIAFETEIIPDNTLALGETRVEEEGENGEITITYKDRIVNGEILETTKSEEVTKDPKTRIVRVGTYTPDIENEVVTTEKKVIPHETEVIPDPTLALGETVVEAEGHDGEITVTNTTKVVNGVVGKTDRREEITLKPQTRVVRVGTYTPDIENTIVNTEKKRIDYETEVIFDDTIELGKEVVENEGEYGEITVTFTTEVVNGAVIRNDRKETITKQPVTRTVRVGTKTEDQKSEVITTNKKTIHHETEIIFDDNLELGKTEIVTKGRDGEITITNKTPVINGAVGETVTSEKITIYPITEVVKVGTKTEDIKNTVTNTEVRPIDYETEVIFDDTIELGKTVVEKEGEKGELTITFTNEVVNGVVGKTNREEKVTKEPVTRVVRVGTKTEDTHSTVVNKVEKKIPYETEIIPDDSLELGKSEVVEEGEEGILTETYTTEVINGIAGETKVDSKISKQPVNRVVRIGTKTEGYNHVVVTKNTKPIPHETEIIPDDTLALGETVVEAEGHDGEITITNRTPIVGGVEGKTTSTEDITKEPETRVVRVGTKTSEIVVSKSTRPIPHETEIIFDDTLQLGQTKVVEEGADGIITVTHTVPIENGIAGKPIITEKISKQPTTRVVKVGTKTEDQKSTVVTTDKRPIAHNTDIIFDKDLELGKVIIDEEGSDGELTITKTTPVVNGAVGKTETTEKITKEAVTRVVRVGTKYEDIKPTYNGEFVTTDTRKIPFETEVIFDNTLNLGKTIIETKGEEGEITTIYTLKIENGKVISTSKDEKVTKNPTTEVIRIGTLDSKPKQDPKETIKEISYEDIDFNTDYIYDPNRNVGDDKLLTPGKKGKKKITTTTIGDDSSTTEEVIEEATDEVWIIGTKKIDPEIQPELPELKYRELPLEVEYITDDSLDEGVEIVIQEGQTAVYALDENGEYILPALREGKTRIIKRGNKKSQEPRDYIDETIKTQYIDTDLLEEGFSLVISNGQAGRYYIDKNGKKVYVIQAMDRVIIRGTRKNNKTSSNNASSDNDGLITKPTYPPADNKQLEIPSKEGESKEDKIDLPNNPSNPYEKDVEIQKLIDEINKANEEFNNGSVFKDKDESKDLNKDANNSSKEEDMDDNSDKVKYKSDRDRVNASSKFYKENSSSYEKDMPSTTNTNNPKTGVEGSLSILSILAAASSAYKISKKKED